MRKTWLWSLLPVLVMGIYAATRGYAEQPKADKDGFNEWAHRPSEPFSDGEASFQKVFQTLKDRYLDDGLSEDELYRAAAMGMLQYADAKRSDWNKLLTPTEYKEILADLKGEVVGVGVEIRFDSESGMGVVLGVIPGTPADRGGVKVGDRILKVDDRSFAGMQLRDIVYAMRGKVGTKVKLTLLREARIVDLTLTRSRLPFEEAEVSALPNDLALVRVRSFTQQTAAKVRAGLQALPAGTKGLIVDVRSCQGGSFDAAIATTSLFLPKDSVVARLKLRGDRDDSKIAGEEPVAPSVPTSVLIDQETSSGCELMAGSLKQNRDATLIGTKTFGKWSMQTVDELENHYAMKYTIAEFSPPDGKDYNGKGLEPDVPVTADPSQVRKLDRLPLAERLEQDQPLITARSLLQSLDD